MSRRRRDPDDADLIAKRLAEYAIWYFAEPYFSALRNEGLLYHWADTIRRALKKERQMTASSPGCCNGAGRLE
jgi:hypothetical protein